MDELLYNIALAGMCSIIAYAGGAAARYSAEARMFFNCIFGFVFFGVGLSSGLLGQELHIGPMVGAFLLIVLCAGPLGYITAPLILSGLESKTESFMGSNGFDATYRKFTRKKYEQNKRQFENFRWYNATDYHDWRSQQQSHSRAKQGARDDFRSYSQGSQYSQGRKRQSHTASPNAWMSDKDKMFNIMGLSVGADAKQIKSAYRKLARKYHPDILASQNLSAAKLEAANKRMKEINTAHDWLENNGYA